MRREIIKIEGDSEDRPYFLLVTRGDTDKDGIEEVVVSFMMDLSQRTALLEHLVNHIDEDKILGITIRFGLKPNTDDDPLDALKIFNDSIKSRL